MYLIKNKILSLTQFKYKPKRNIIHNKVFINNLQYEWLLITPDIIQGLIVKNMLSLKILHIFLKILFRANPSISITTNKI